MRLNILFSVYIMVATLFFSLAGANAADLSTPSVDRFRAYLIYEDSGELSKNMAKRDDQIVANDEKGTSVQMLVDVVMAGKKGQLYENNPFLYVVVREAMAETGAPPMLDTGFPLTFVGQTGELVRTLVVNHNCSGFDIEAYIMDGDRRTSELKKTFSITCGD